MIYSKLGPDLSLPLDICEAGQHRIGCCSHIFLGTNDFKMMMASDERVDFWMEAFLVEHDVEQKIFEGNDSEFMMLLTF